MEAEQMERELRKRLESHVGRPLTDDEWETFKRIQLQSAETDRSGEATAARPWTGQQVAELIAALVAAAAGVSLAYEWDFVFSLFVRVPLAFFVWLIALRVVGFWLRGVFTPPFSWEWLFWGFICVCVFVVPFAVAGGTLLFEDRGYLTSTQKVFGQEFTPTGGLAVGLLIASLVLAWIGWPALTLVESLGSYILRKLGSFALRNLWWFIGGLIYIPIAVGSIKESGRPFAVTAGWLIAGGVFLLVTAVSAADTKRASAAGPFGLFLFIVALGFACADLVMEERPIEIALWLPLIAIAAFGSVLCVSAVLGEGNWPVRVGRMLVGLIAIAPALGVAGALRVSPW